ncbi:unnamed protein product [Boreogadus saida]
MVKTPRTQKKLHTATTGGTHNRAYDKENISPEEEYKIACLLMVFVAVSMPTLADMSLPTGLIQLLKIGQETDKMTTRNRESVYLLLDISSRSLPFLTMDLLESCFPYVCCVNAYPRVYKQSISANP